MPGGGAELFHPDVRSKIIRGKCTGQQWLDTIEVAHNLGIKSNVTMLYGHIEKPEHVVDHLIKIRELQKKTNGFITLIPLKFSLDNTELEKEHKVTHESSSIYDLKIIALSRLMLAQTLKNISVYWVAYGTNLPKLHCHMVEMIWSALHFLRKFIVQQASLQILLYWNWQLCKRDWAKTYSTKYIL